MIWKSFDEGFTSVADASNGDNVVLKILDYEPTNIELTEWAPIWKTLNNRNYSRGLTDRANDDLKSLPSNNDVDYKNPEDDFELGRVLSIGRPPSTYGAAPALAMSDLGIAGRGVYPVGRRENLIPGSDLATASIGSPGTLPGDMFTTAVSSKTVDAIGTMNGINYVDVTLNVSAGSVANIYLFATGSNTIFKSSSDGDPTGAGVSIPIDFTWFLGMRPGSFSNINQTVGMRTGEHTNASFATGSYTNQNTQYISIPNDGVVRPFSMSGVVPQDASTKPCILPGLIFTKVHSSLPATIPLRIGWPIIDTTGWFHQRRRGLAFIVPLTAKADSVFKAHRRLQPMLPVQPNTFGSLTRKKFTFVFDSIVDQLNTAESVSASIMPILRIFNSNAAQNVLTLCLQVDNSLPGMRPVWFNILTGSYIAGTDGVFILPSRKFKIAASLDSNGLRWSVNGGSVTAYSNGNNSGISQYYINNLMLDGTGYLFKRFDAIYRTCTNAELQALSL